MSATSGTDIADELPRSDCGSERLARARSGCTASLGELYESSRRYLLLIANRQVDAELRAKVPPSDLVQETLVRAQRCLPQFAGKTEAELRAWLRAILINTARNAMRNARRGIRAELAGEESELLAQAAAQQESPSQVAIAAEHTALLEQSLARLPADYRQVILLRNLDRLPFAEIGRQMDRSGDAARKLWVRAIRLLQAVMGVGNESP